MGMPLNIPFVISTMDTVIPMPGAVGGADKWEAHTKAQGACERPSCPPSLTTKAGGEGLTPVTGEETGPRATTALHSNI